MISITPPFLLDIRLADMFSTATAKHLTEPKQCFSFLETLQIMLLKTAHLQNMHAVQVIRLGLHEGKAAQDIASKASQRHLLS